MCACARLSPAGNTKAKCAIFFCKMLTDKPAFRHPAVDKSVNRGKGRGQNREGVVEVSVVREWMDWDPDNKASDICI